MSKRRSFGKIRKLPSNKWQASFIGPDKQRHYAPRTFTFVSQAKDWLKGQESLLILGKWKNPAQPETIKLVQTYLFAEYAERHIEVQTSAYRLSVEAEETGQAQIVVDSNGVYTTIFNNQDAHKIQVRTSDDGVTWDAIFTVAQENSSQYLGNPQIAVDGSGRVTGIWEAYDTGGDVKMIASRSSTSPGAWTDATPLIGGDAIKARIAATESGLTTVTAFSDFSEVEIQSRSSQDGGAWTTAVGHGTGDGGVPNVSVVAPNTVVVTWYNYADNGLYASSSENGVEWTTNQLIESESVAPYGVDKNHRAKIYADSSGQLTAVWMRDYDLDTDNQRSRVTASTSADGVTWTEPIELAGNSSFSVNLVVDSNCRVTALYELSNDTGNTVQSRTLDRGGCSASGGGSEDLAETGMNDGVTAVAVLAAAGIVAAAVIRRRARV